MCVPTIAFDDLCSNSFVESIEAPSADPHAVDCGVLHSHSIISGVEQCCAFNGSALYNPLCSLLHTCCIPEPHCAVLSWYMCMAVIMVCLVSWYCVFVVYTFRSLS